MLRVNSVEGLRVNPVQTSCQDAKKWIQKAEHDLIPSEKRPDIKTEILNSLNPYATEIRFPGVWEDLSRTDALEAIRIAKVIKEKISNLDFFGSFGASNEKS